ncbi:EAL domain-containing protein [Acidithiobacillus montserratensis]|uniref:EAL domain-containing protein n=1 Tax=Acidithiobacillus montserratensis TaxID=2729135 RepID=A0ACD5HID4_9PROT|nr:EAL domain-containing protein [Acidithiobacillus montserratensis]MBU2746579.1 EAL domain-containing protein [Acidithiobacillus montserratensis]
MPTDIATDYRLEPIVNLSTGEAIGNELLAGKTTCPQWTPKEWELWYGWLSVEIPKILASTPGLLFFNLSGEQILNHNILRSVRQLRDYADRIIIEWTEQDFLHERFVDVIVKLNFLKGMGFGLAIDDVASQDGVDGLGRAGAIKHRFCKIDGAYFQRAREYGPDFLRGLCQHLSMHETQVIAEWIETEEDYRIAQDGGAHLGQGWFFR